MQKDTERESLAPSPPVVVADFVEPADDPQLIPEHALVTVSYQEFSVSLRKHEIRRGVRHTIFRDKPVVATGIVVGPHGNTTTIFRYVNTDFMGEVAIKITKGFHCVLTGEKPPEGVKISSCVDEPKWIWCGYGWAQ